MTKMARKRKAKRIASYARLRRNRILLITNIIYLLKSNTPGETGVPW